MLFNLAQIQGTFAGPKALDLDEIGSGTSDDTRRAIEENEQR